MRIDTKNEEIDRKAEKLDDLPVADEQAHETTGGICSNDQVIDFSTGFEYTQGASVKR